MYPTPLRVLHLLKDIDDVSTFYKMMTRFNVEEVFKATHVQKVCFTDDKCVSITSTVGERLKDPSVNSLHFSIVAPTNDMFKEQKKDMTSLMNDRRLQENFVQEHILIGSFSESNTSGPEGGGARSVSPLSLIHI